jgi:hypothetical protein
MGNWKTVRDDQEVSSKCIKQTQDGMITGEVCLAQCHPGILFIMSLVVALIDDDEITFIRKFPYNSTEKLGFVLHSIHINAGGMLM